MPQARDLPALSPSTAQEIAGAADSTEIPLVACQDCWRQLRCAVADVAGSTMRDDMDGAQTGPPGERGSHSSWGAARAV
jgi:hypothetical protein